MPEETLIDPSAPQALSVAETVVLVGRYTRECDRTVSDVAERLGWTEDRLSKFREDYAELLAMDHQMNWTEPPQPVLPPSDSDLFDTEESSDIPNTPPTDEQVAMAIQKSDDKLKLMEGLKAIGLTDRAVEEATALQQFNNGHFKDSMGIVSAGLLKTDILAVMEVSSITERLKFVREQIASYGEFGSDDRDRWVREEQLLMAQFVETGHLMVAIKGQFYKGAAQLAVMKMYMEKGVKGHSMMTQRSANKPAFRPSVMTTEEE